MLLSMKKVADDLQDLREGACVSMSLPVICVSCTQLQRLDDPAASLSLLILWVCGMGRLLEDVDGGWYVGARP